MKPDYKTRIFLSCVILLSQLLINCSGKQKDWNYDKKGSDWPDTCKTGEQSPIDISQPFEYKSMNISFAYTNMMTEYIFQNDGNNLFLEGDFGYMTLNNVSFFSNQIQFYSPSMHTFSNKRLPLEIQIIHNDGDGNVLSVSILFMKSKDEYSSLLGKLGFDNPEQKEQLPLKPSLVTEPIYLNKYVNDGKDFFIYDGREASPPCTKSVTHLILTDILKVSKSQLDNFPKIIKNRNRSVQKRNDRKIYTTFKMDDLKKKQQEVRKRVAAFDKQKKQNKNADEANIQNNNTDHNNSINANHNIPKISKKNVTTIKNQNINKIHNKTLTTKQPKNCEERNMIPIEIVMQKAKAYDDYIKSDDPKFIGGGETTNKSLLIIDEDIPKSTSELKRAYIEDQYNQWKKLFLRTTNSTQNVDPSLLIQMQIFERELKKNNYKPYIKDKNNSNDKLLLSLVQLSDDNFIFIPKNEVEDVKLFDDEKITDKDYQAGLEILNTKDEDLDSLLNSYIKEANVESKKLALEKIKKEEALIKERKKEEALIKERNKEEALIKERNKESLKPFVKTKPTIKKVTVFKTDGIIDRNGFVDNNKIQKADHLSVSRDDSNHIKINSNNPSILGKLMSQRLPEHFLKQETELKKLSNSIKAMKSYQLNPSFDLGSEQQSYFPIQERHFNINNPSDDKILQKNSVSDDFLSILDSIHHTDDLKKNEKLDMKPKISKMDEVNFNKLKYVNIVKDNAEKIRITSNIPSVLGKIVENNKVFKPNSPSNKKTFPTMIKEIAKNENNKQTNQDSTNRKFVLDKLSKNIKVLTQPKTEKIKIKIHSQNITTGVHPTTIIGNSKIIDKIVENNKDFKPNNLSNKNSKIIKTEIKSDQHLKSQDGIHHVAVITDNTSKVRINSNIPSILRKVIENNKDFKPHESLKQQFNQTEVIIVKTPIPHALNKPEIPSVLDKLEENIKKIESNENEATINKPIKNNLEIITYKKKDIEINTPNEFKTTDGHLSATDDDEDHKKETNNFNNHFNKYKKLKKIFAKLNYEDSEKLGNKDKETENNDQTVKLYNELEELKKTKNKVEIKKIDGNNKNKQILNKEFSDEKKATSNIRKFEQMRNVIDDLDHSFGARPNSKGNKNDEAKEEIESRKKYNNKITEEVYDTNLDFNRKIFSMLDITLNNLVSELKKLDEINNKLYHKPEESNFVTMEGFIRITNKNLALIIRKCKDIDQDEKFSYDDKINKLYNFESKIIISQNKLINDNNNYYENNEVNTNDIKNILEYTQISTDINKLNKGKKNSKRMNNLIIRILQKLPVVLMKKQNSGEHDSGYDLSPVEESKKDNFSDSDVFITRKNVKKIQKEMEVLGPKIKEQRESQLKPKPGDGRKAVSKDGVIDQTEIYDTLSWPSKCKSGLQSPININKPYIPEETKLIINLKPLRGNIKLSNDGFKLILTADSFGNIMHGSHQYDAKQIEFHHPSEHTFGDDEIRSPMEIQVILQDMFGNTAALSVLFKLQEHDNEFLTYLGFGVDNPIFALKLRNNETIELNEKLVSDKLDLGKLINKTTNYITYIGSLTSPPCTQQVQWFILLQKLGVSPNQLDYFPVLFGRDTNVRGLQSLNNRRLKII